MHKTLVLHLWSAFTFQMISPSPLFKSHSVQLPGSILHALFSWSSQIPQIKVSSYISFLLNILFCSEITSDYWSKMGCKVFHVDFKVSNPYLWLFLDSWPLSSWRFCQSEWCWLQNHRPSKYLFILHLSVQWLPLIKCYFCIIETF